VDFVWMKHVGVDQPAKVPATAVPHWEGHGWEQTDPPAKPARPVRSYLPATAATTEQAVDAAAKTLDAAPAAPAGH
jgi:hypothetical protein